MKAKKLTKIGLIRETEDLKNELEEKQRLIRQLEEKIKNPNELKNSFGVELKVEKLGGSKRNILVPVGDNEVHVLPARHANEIYQVLHQMFRIG